MQIYVKKERKKRIKYCIVLIFIHVRFRERYFMEKLNFVPGISVRFNECPLYRDCFIRV